MYIEEIIIENFIISIILINIYTSFLNLNISKIKKIALVIIYTLFSLYIKIYKENSVFLTTILNIVIIYLITKIKSIKQYIKSVIYFNVLYFMLIGYIFFFLLIFKLNLDLFILRIIYYILVGMLLKFSADLMWKMWITKIKYRENTFKIKIQNMGKYEMLLDTGNFAKFNDLPIIVMNENCYINKIKKRKKEISCLKSYDIILKTIEGEKSYKGYLFENIILKKEGEKERIIKKAIITFTKQEIQNGMFDGILPFDILIEK